MWLSKYLQVHIWLIYSEYDGYMGDINEYIGYMG